MIIELLTKRYPGMRLWLSQRVALLMIKPNTYMVWHDLTSHGLFKVSTYLFFICLSMHAWLGVRDVLRDYVYNLTLRAFFQIVIDLLLALYLVWFGVVVWQI